MPTIQTPVPPRSEEGDLRAFEQALQSNGLRAALLYLNQRTPHRYTGVFRFDAAMLRSVALVDKWDPTVEFGEDVPLASAYCARLYQTKEPLAVEDGREDVPGMAGSPVVSYCGALIFATDRTPWGALCHFDTARCDPKRSDMPLLIAASAVIFEQANTSTTKRTYIQPCQIDT